MLKTETSTLVFSTGAASVVTLLIFRYLKRRNSPVIRSKLSCKCGKIQGEIKAIKDDSTRLTCYCNDCRDYANFIASLGNNSETIVGEHGESCIVQVCKSAVTISQGQENLKLAHKASPNTGMDRFYAGCCHVPLMNTFSSLGFVGVLADFLDEEQKKFAGPVRFCPHEALVEKTKLKPEPDVFLPTFLWNLFRYQMWRSCGPFDYNIKPVYWGVKTKA